MRRSLAWVTLFSLFTASAALADDPTPDKPDKPTEIKRAFRAAAKERDALVRGRGRVFAKIAVDHNYGGEYVLYRDDDATAFLDLKDPQHPRHHARPNESKRTAHILVVPNQPREHVGKTLTSDISADDLEATLKVFHVAESLAKQLAIQNARIYIKPAEKVGIGYLHVHIEGERDPSVAYPPPLK